MCIRDRAYTKCDYYADEMMQYLQQSRDMMMAYMKERIPRIKLAEPDATYLMWLDCRDLNMTCLLYTSCPGDTRTSKRS